METAAAPSRTSGKLAVVPIPAILRFRRFRPAMRRLFLIFLVVILPFQFAWAGAAAYCQHEETVRGAGHFGHHEHRHQNTGSTASNEVSSEPGQDRAHQQVDTKDKLTIDSDCGICHIASVPFACAAQTSTGIVARADAAPFHPPMRFASHSATAPDRPQWPRLA